MVIDHANDYKKWVELYSSGEMYRFDFSNQHPNIFLRNIIEAGDDAPSIIRGIYETYNELIHKDRPFVFRFYDHIAAMGIETLSSFLIDRLPILASKYHALYNYIHSSFEKNFFSLDESDYASSIEQYRVEAEKLLNALNNIALGTIHKIHDLFFGNFLRLAKIFENRFNIRMSYHEYIDIIENYISTEDFFYNLLTNRTFIAKVIKFSGSSFTEGYTSDYNIYIMKGFFEKFKINAGPVFYIKDSSGDFLFLKEELGSLLRDHSGKKNEIERLIIELLYLNLKSFSSILTEKKLDGVLSILIKDGKINLMKLMLSKYDIIKVSNIDNFIKEIIKECLNDIFTFNLNNKIDKMHEEIYKKLLLLLDSEYIDNKFYDIHEILNIRLIEIISECRFEKLDEVLADEISKIYFDDKKNGLYRLCLNFYGELSDIIDKERRDLLANREHKKNIGGYKTGDYDEERTIAENSNILNSKYPTMIMEEINGYKGYSEWVNQSIRAVDQLLITNENDFDIKWVFDFFKRVKTILIKLFGYEERYLLGKSKERFGPFTKLINEIIKNIEDEMGSVLGITYFYETLLMCILNKKEIISATDDAQIIKIYFKSKVSSDLFDINNTNSDSESISANDMYNFYMFKIKLLEKILLNPPLKSYVLDSFSSVPGTMKEKLKILFNLSKITHNTDLKVEDLLNDAYGINIFRSNNLYKISTNLGVKIYNFYITLNKYYSLLNDHDLITEINKEFKEDYISNDLINTLKIYGDSMDKLFEDFYSSDMKSKENIDKFLTLVTKFNMLIKFNSIKKYIKVAEKKNLNLFKINHDFNYEDNKYRFRVLEDYDPYHFQVGADTNCCQIIGGAGNNAAIDSFVNSLAGVLLLEVYNKSINDYELLCQSYFHYIPEDNGIILDNIENTNKVKKIKEDIISNIYKIYAEYLCKIGFKYVYCGIAHTTVLGRDDFKKGRLRNDPRSFAVEDKLDLSRYTDFDFKNFYILQG